MKAFSLEIVKFVFTSKMLSANLVTVTITLELLKSVVIVVRNMIKVGNKGTRGMCEFVQS